MTPDERFSNYCVDSLVGCWLYYGSHATGGYGQFGVDGKSVSAHRYAYERKYGRVPKGLVLDHLCRVRHCVNPDHLEVVTYAENRRRGLQGPKKHCKKGHEFTDDNTYIYGNRRKCRTCTIERASARYYANK